MLPMPDYSNMFTSWLKLASGFMEMTMNANEVIYHRTMKIASGAMTQPEVVAMVMEKATAFATSTERAAMAAARGGDPVGIATEALHPYRAKTRSNARKLRN